MRHGPGDNRLSEVMRETSAAFDSPIVIVLLVDPESGHVVSGAYSLKRKDQREAYCLSDAAHDAVHDSIEAGRDEARAEEGEAVTLPAMVQIAKRVG